jgi:hypothetical protein
MVAGPRKGKMRSSPNAKIAYTPMSEKEKEAAMKQLIKDLHSGKKGGYRSPGGTRTNISDRH